MYTINVKSYINASPVKLMKIWRNPQILLKHASNIKKLDILKRERNKVLTAWEVEIDKVLLKWSQWDVLDTSKGVITFKLHEGDFHFYSGQWNITPEDDNRSLIFVSADIDWGIPHFEPYAKKSLIKKTTMLFKEFIFNLATTLIDER